MKTEVKSNGKTMSVSLTPENDFERVIIETMNLFDLQTEVYKEKETESIHIFLHQK